MTKQEFYAAVARAQTALKAPKDMDNKFGGYKYRNAESILAAAKPLLAAAGLAINLTDEIVIVGDRYYIRARASITDGENAAEATAWAREPLAKKGMDDSQVTGSASSYARKYALCGLFGIDDSTADPDNPDNHPDNPETAKREARLHPAQKAGQGTQPATASKPAQAAAQKPAPAKSDAAIRAELDAIADLDALVRYSTANRAALEGRTALLTARKAAILDDIKARVDAAATRKDLDALRAATPGAHFKDAREIFDAAAKSLDEIAAVM